MKSFSNYLKKSAGFINQQQRDWKITVIRTSLERLAYQTIYPYISIYIVALGASATYLGLVNSIGMLIAGLVGPFTGWFIDRTGPKKIYLIGIGLIAVSYLTYAIALSWIVTIVAMAAYWLGFSISIHSCATICGNCLVNDDRATGMTICETTAAGLLGMAGPMLGAWMVTIFGGIDAEGIRPIFFFCLVITLITFIVVKTQLSNRSWSISSDTKPNIFRDIYQVMKEGQYLKRWLIISAVSQLPLSMVMPFSQLFAHEIKGATTFILGAMVTGSALSSIVFAIPLGRLADRVGRKRVLFMTIPLFWISNLILVGAPNQGFLVIAGVLQGFFWIGGPISAAMERELIAPNHMGKWLGLVRMFRMLISACMAMVCGVIWDKIGPQYVFLTFILIELFLRVPLLFSMPETLDMRIDRQISPRGI